MPAFPPHHDPPGPLPPAHVLLAGEPRLPAIEINPARLVGAGLAFAQRAHGPLRLHHGGTLLSDKESHLRYIVITCLYKDRPRRAGTPTRAYIYTATAGAVGA